MFLNPTASVPSTVQLLSVPLVGVPKIGVTKVGVTSVGEVESTTFPLPVDVVTPVPPDATAKVADKPAAVPVVFWLNVGNVQLAKLPLVGVPKIGVTKVGVTSVGEVESTTFPLPVDVVTPVPPDATAKVADKPAAVPVVFWLNVGHVNVPELKFPLVGVPSKGVTNVGEVDSTTLPLPVDVVTPVPPFDAGIVDAIPVGGRPVQLVNVPLTGVPKAGATRVGEGGYISTKSEPFQTTKFVFPAAVEIPVVDAPLITTAALDWLMM
jgi:hypothetical protein